MKPRPNKNQLSLFDTIPLVVERKVSYRDLLIEQIIRDSRVLNEEPEFQAPDREFFEQRIASYKEELSRIG